MFRGRSGLSVLELVSVIVYVKVFFRFCRYIFLVLFIFLFVEVIGVVRVGRVYFRCWNEKFIGGDCSIEIFFGFFF